ncbi:helix-turn-helix domain-containing protein [Paenibacillus illinoisensis]|uniref:helix-turn-helix domain-containing protein n=1 Tax=Paenibacillus illinoisensis TaxID=59845 RepID=UPI00301BA22C
MENHNPNRRRSPLEEIMDVQEAAQIWGLQPSYIKDLCRLELEKKGLAKKKGNTWILDRNQPNPSKAKF